MPKREMDVPEVLNGVWESMAATLEELKRTITGTGGGKAVDYGAVEDRIAERARRMERASHQAILEELDIDVPAVVIGGERYIRVGRCEAPYHTLAGSVSVERSLYRRAGARGGTPEGRVVDPVSLRAGVVGDGWLPHTARAMAHAGQQGTSREAETRAQEWGRLPYSRSSFERVTHLVGALNVAALHTIRYGCMPEGDLPGLRNRLVADVATLVSKQPRVRIQLLCDGAPEMWSLLDDGFTREKFGDRLHELVDLYHLMEKLAPAAHVLDGDTVAKTLGAWKLALLNRPQAATRIRMELELSGKEHVTVGKEQPVHAAMTYLTRHSADADRMNYARARRLGLPLGSGNVEATCKSLFEQRLKRCGARWKTTTGEHIVSLRALALSDRWGPAIQLTLRPLRKAVRPAA